MGLFAAKRRPQASLIAGSSVPFGRPAGRLGLLFVEWWQAVHDVHGLHAHADDLLYQIDDVARFGRVFVRIVDDAALLVRRDLVCVLMLLYIVKGIWSRPNWRDIASLRTGIMR